MAPLVIIACITDAEKAFTSGQVDVPLKIFPLRLPFSFFRRGYDTGGPPFDVLGVFLRIKATLKKIYNSLALSRTVEWRGSTVDAYT